MSEFQRVRRAIEAGLTYRLGIGGRQDQEQAKKWYQRVSLAFLALLPLMQTGHA